MTSANIRVDVAVTPTANAAFSWFIDASEIL
jgi:hypothetical protein